MDSSERTKRDRLPMRFLILFMAIIQFAGCDALHTLLDPGDADEPRIIELRTGQTKWLAAERNFLTFEKVTQDSRCPLNVICVWEGDGAAMLTLRGYDGSVAACTLHTTLEPKSAIINGLSISLRTLSPYPIYGTRIDPAEYIVTLEEKLSDRKEK
jgi:hypothetical protein